MNLSKLDPTTLAAVAVMILVALVIFKGWLGRAEAADREAKARADKRKQAEFEARMNAALEHPEPLEPAPIEHVRHGRGVPRPVTSEELRETVDIVRGVRPSRGPVSGVIPLGPAAPSTTPSSGESSTATSSATATPAPSTTPPPADPLANAVQALQGMRKPG